jgi:hypothetical protein
MTRLGGFLVVVVGARSSQQWENFPNLLSFEMINIKTTTE